MRERTVLVCHRFLLTVILTDGSCGRWSLAAFYPQVDLDPLIVLLEDAVILAQRMSLPAVGQQNSLHVGMAVKLDAEHIVNFALQPVGPRPDGNGTWNALAVPYLCCHTNALVTCVGVQNP